MVVRTLSNPFNLHDEEVHSISLVRQDLPRHSMAGEHLLCQGMCDGCRFFVNRRTSRGQASAHFVKRSTTVRMYLAREYLARGGAQLSIEMHSYGAPATKGSRALCFRGAPLVLGALSTLLDHPWHRISPPMPASETGYLVRGLSDVRMPSGGFVLALPMRSNCFSIGTSNWWHSTTPLDADIHFR